MAPRVKILCDSCAEGKHQCNGLVKTVLPPGFAAMGVCAPGQEVTVRCACPQCRRRFSRLVEFDKERRKNERHKRRPRLPLLTFEQYLEEQSAPHTVWEAKYPKGHRPSPQEMLDKHLPPHSSSKAELFFYYLRDSKSQPVVTVCLLRAKMKSCPVIVTRGIALCHPKDNPTKAYGRWRAFLRARAGLWGTTWQVTLTEEMLKRVNEVWACNPDKRGVLGRTPTMQVTYDQPVLTSFEKRILNKPKKAKKAQERKTLTQQDCLNDWHIGNLGLTKVLRNKFLDVGHATIGAVRENYKQMSLTKAQNQLVAKRLQEFDNDHADELTQPQ